MKTDYVLSTVEKSSLSSESAVLTQCKFVSTSMAAKATCEDMARQALKAAMEEDALRLH